MIVSRQVRAHAARLIAALCNLGRAAVSDLTDEVARLNRARLPLGHDGQRQPSRSARVRAVKDALAAHHDRPSRCC